MSTGVFRFWGTLLLIYSLLVLSPPHSGHGVSSAVEFARSAIARGHQIQRAFFLDDGVYSGSSKSVFPQDESNPAAPWAELAQEHSVELILCVSSALKRGLLDETEADRYDLPGATVHPAFTISGLGQLIDACDSSDRMLTFGGH
ncbi:MAG: tRNA 2-thiouridine synthesizing protein D [Halioglobus sp.]